MEKDKNIEEKSNLFILEGDILKSKMQTLVNPVNCMGVLGAGLAKKFKEKYGKDYEKEYIKQCREKELEIGKLTLWKGKDKWILNFPTKYHWVNPSKLEWIEKGLKYFLENYKKLEIKSIAFPALGCNLGGLVWMEVRPLMLKYLTKTDIPVEIYEPKRTQIEKVLDILVENLIKEFSEKIEDISIIRSIYPKSDGWTDWKKCKTLNILIGAAENSIDHKLENIKKLLKINIQYEYVRKRQLYKLKISLE